MAVQTLQANTLQYAQDITLDGDWEVLGTIPGKVRIQVNNGSITVQKQMTTYQLLQPMVTST